MTREEKQTLLTALCCYLPYGLKIEEYNDEYGYHDAELNTICTNYFLEDEASFEGDWINRIENIRPYLRPLSSMTSEEKEELNKKYRFDIFNNEIRLNYHSEGYWDDDLETNSIDYLFLFNWLNSHHFDYRGLIKEELAIEAPEGMYKN